MPVRCTLLGFLLLIVGIPGPVLAAGPIVDSHRFASDPSAVTTDVPEQAFHELFAEAISLQKEKRFAEAAAVVERIIRENEENEEVVRRALNRLVYIHTKWDEGDAEGAATQALSLFPDLEANTVWIPSHVNDLYTRLRETLFGSLTIRKPDDCRVHLDGEPVGSTPLFVPYLDVGEYDLKVTRKRHHDYVERISIEPGGDHSFEISLKPLRDLRYWLPRIATGGLAAGVIYVLVSPDDTELTPLPGAPAEPTGK